MGKLTLEEAIAHAKEVAEKNYRGADFESIDSIDDDIKANCIKCAEEKYKVRSWDDMKREFGIAQTGDEIYIPCLAFFVKDMCRFCGTTITVSYFIYDNVFRIEEDNGRYMWSTDMIAPLGDLYEAIQSRRHCPDSTME